MSNSSHNKGEYFEKCFSRIYHKNDLPVLCSSLTLRSRSIGQIDICKLVKNNNFIELKVVELKHSKFPSFKQIQRLRNSCNFLSEIIKPDKTTLLLAQKSKFNRQIQITSLS